MAITRWLVTAAISAAAAEALAQMPLSTDGTDPKTWDRKLDATRAAPKNPPDHFREGRHPRAVGQRAAGRA
jgi:hypothetical protein